MILKLAFVLTISIANAMLMGNPKNYDKKLYDLDKHKLKEMWQVAGVKGIMKAKARQVYTSLPFAEKIIFQQCSADAKKVGELAQCVVRLLNERDRIQKSTKDREIAENYKKPKLSSKTSLGKIVQSKNLFIPPPRPKSEWDFSETKYAYSAHKKSIKPFSVLEKAFSNYRQKGIEVRKIIRPQIRAQKITAKKVRSKRDKLERTLEIIVDEALSSKDHQVSRSKIRRAVSIVTGESFLSLRENFTSTSKKENENWSNLLKNDTSLPTKNSSTVLVTTQSSKIMDRLKGTWNKFINKYIVPTGEGKKRLNNSDSLTRLKQHFLRLEKCNSYFKTISEDNNKLSRKMKIPVDSETPSIANHDDVLKEVLDIVNNYLGNKSQETFSLLSPRLLSIVPQRNSDSTKNTAHLLSPNLFSFQNDGLLSMRDLVSLFTSNQKSQYMLLEMVMDLSGASEALEKVIVQLEPQMRHMEEFQYPLVRDMSLLDLGYLRAHKTFSDRQQFEWEHKGYTFYTQEQMDLIHNTGSRLVPSNKLNMKDIIQMNIEEKEKFLEDEIRKLAEISKGNGTRRFKRQEGEGGQAGTGGEEESSGEGSGEGSGVEGEEGTLSGEATEEEEEGGVEWITLRPTVFSNLINEGASGEIFTLSPHALFAEIVAPDALSIEVLSPRALVATILSPSALFARILSPTALRAEVLSPRALSAWVLSPEAMVTQVMSPRVFEPRILSSETLVIDILSPGLLSPHWQSSESLGFSVLSPNILSPRIESEEKMLVEILSPHILGGPHSEEEKEHEVLTAGSGEEGNSGVHSPHPGNHAGPHPDDAQHEGEPEESPAHAFEHLLGIESDHDHHLA